MAAGRGKGDDPRQHGDVKLAEREHTPPAAKDPEPIRRPIDNSAQATRAARARGARTAEPEEISAEPSKLYAAAGEAPAARPPGGGAPPSPWGAPGLPPPPAPPPFDDPDRDAN